MNKILVVITAFSLGYVLNDLTEGNVQLIPEARADVAGMSAIDLAGDNAFKEAVKTVVEDKCYVTIRKVMCL